MQKFTTILALVLGTLVSFPQKATEIPEEISFARRNIKKNYDHYSLYVWYPEAEPNGIVEEQRHAINLAIQTIMTQSITSFQNECRKVVEQNAAQAHAELYFDYLVNFTSSRIVSLRFQEDKRFGGAQENAKQVLTLNYNIEKNRDVKPGNLFDREKEAELLSLLRSKMPEGVIPDPKYLFNKFSLTDTAIIFHFDASNSNRPEMHEVALSWREAKPLLAQDSDAEVFLSAYNH